MSWKQRELVCMYTEFHLYMYVLPLVHFNGKQFYQELLRWFFFSFQFHFYFYISFPLVLGCRQ